MTDRIQRWENLCCQGCDAADSFVDLKALRFKPGGGMVPELVGYACFACGQKADTNRMQQALERRKRLQELEQLSRDLGVPMALPQEGT
jgi:hypothetical protein